MGKFSPLYCNFILTVRLPCPQNTLISQLAECVGPSLCQCRPTDLRRWPPLRDLSWQLPLAGFQPAASFCKSLAGGLGSLSLLQSLCEGFPLWGLKLYGTSVAASFLQVGLLGGLASDHVGRVHPLEHGHMPFLACRLASTMIARFHVAIVGLRIHGLQSMRAMYCVCQTTLWQ